MRIKHFAGYGCVNAKKLSDKTYKAEEVVRAGRELFIAPRVVEIKVSGLHECGLDRHRYVDDCYNWLLKRFCKDVKAEDVLALNYTENDYGDEAIYQFIVRGENTWY